jgi:hypothetical protein
MLSIHQSALLMTFFCVVLFSILLSGEGLEKFLRKELNSGSSKRRMLADHHHNLHQYIKILPLIDQKACSNNPLDHYITANYDCFNEHRQPTKCVVRKTIKIAGSECELIQLTLISEDGLPLHENHVHHMISELFIMADANTAFRRMMIQFSKESHSSVSKLVDEMITPRPWWDVMDESFPALDTHSEGPSTSKVYQIVLDRYHPHHEDYLKLISVIQYPDQETCLQTPLMLNRKDGAHPGWTSILAMYYSLQSEMRFAVNAIYVSKANDPAQSTPFISGEDCPTLKNKWECAFLPTTNCSLPSFLKDCNTTNCIEKYEDTTYFTAIFSNFSEDATFISRSKDEKEYQRIVQFSKSPKNALQADYAQKYGATTSLTHLRPRSRDESKQHFFLESMGTSNTLFQSYYLRKTSFYRFKLQQYYKEFYERYPFFRREMNYTKPAVSEFRCIAVHVRRGDRMVYGENMTDYCKTHQSHEDAGCRGNIPFGSFALTPLISKAETLINKKQEKDQSSSDSALEKEQKKKYNLLIASDDPFWLEEQKELYDNAHPDSEWNIVTIFPSSEFNFTRRSSFKNNDEYQKAIWDLRNLRGTKSGIFYHATLQLFQECDGLVGHFGSGVAWMLYRSMCYRNNFGMAICPPGYDLRSGLE